MTKLLCPPVTKQPSSNYLWPKRHLSLTRPLLPLRSTYRVGLTDSKDFLPRGGRVVFFHSNFIPYESYLPPLTGHTFRQHGIKIFLCSDPSSPTKLYTLGEKNKKHMLPCHILHSKALQECFPRNAIARWTPHPHMRFQRQATPSLSDVCTCQSCEVKRAGAAAE